MENILILTDFSDAALHAVQYGCMFAREFGITRIILLNTYQVISPVTTIPVAEEAGIVFLEEESRNGLKQLQADIIKQFPQKEFIVDYISLNADLVEGVSQTVEQQSCELVIMGMTGSSDLAKILLGSNTARLIQANRFPLLVVPGDASIEKPRRLLLTTDLQKINPPISGPGLHRWIQMFRAELFVLNIEKGEERYSPKTEEAIAELHCMLDPYNPQYHYIHADDIIKGLNNFVGERQISLIIALHHSRTFWNNLFHKSISKLFSRHSLVPVLIIPVDNREIKTKKIQK